MNEESFGSAQGGAKKLILEAKNICLIPSENEPESACAALALFYTLKEMGKNVNVIINHLPEKLDFLVPSPDFISQPQNFVISIPRKTADVSQIYYEKNEETLKIHLTVPKGRIKKEDLSCYFANPKPDATITLGIQNFQKEISKLDAFGFLLDSPIINIDNHVGNLKFGAINLVEQKPLSQITWEVIKLLGKDSEPSANAILAGLLIRYENFKSPSTTPEVFQLCGELIRKGADYAGITTGLQKTTVGELQFLGKILEQITLNRGTSAVALDSNDFYNFSEHEAGVAVEKLKTLGIQNSVLVLWKSHASEPTVKGFFYSSKPYLINKFAEYPQGKINNGWVFLQMPGENIEAAKEIVVKLL